MNKKNFNYKNKYSLFAHIFPYKTYFTYNKLVINLYTYFLISNITYYLNPPI